MPFASGSQPIRPLLSLPLTIDPRDRDKFHSALTDLREQFPALHIGLNVRNIPDTHIVHLEGQSESQLTDLTQRLHRYNIEFNVGPLAVLCVETIGKAARAEGKYIRQTGGLGNYGHVKIRVEPNELGQGFDFINEITGGAIPERYIKPIEEGIREAAHGGILSACEVVDFRATLWDGSYHENDSNEMAFRIAGSLAFREAAKKANPILLEPVMAIEITVPEGHTDAILRDLNSRGGRIAEVKPLGGSRVVRAMVSLQNLLGYADELRSRFADQVSCTMEFARYESRPYGLFGDDGEAGFPVSRPHGPAPRTGSAAVDPSRDWT